MFEISFWLSGLQKPILSTYIQNILNTGIQSLWHVYHLVWDFPENTALRACEALSCAEVRIFS